MMNENSESAQARLDVHIHLAASPELAYLLGLRDGGGGLSGAPDARREGKDVPPAKYRFRGLKAAGIAAFVVFAGTAASRVGGPQPQLAQAPPAAAAKEGFNAAGPAGARMPAPLADALAGQPQ